MQEKFNMLVKKKYLLIMCLAITLSFVFTVINFQDYAVGGLLFVIVWFAIALVVDISKGISGGVALDSMSQFSVNNKENFASKVPTLVLSAVIYAATLYISFNATTGAQLLAKQNRTLDNYVSSDAAKEIASLKKQKETNQNALTSLSTSLSTAISKDSDSTKGNQDKWNSLNAQVQEKEKAITKLTNQIAANKSAGLKETGGTITQARADIKKLEKEKSVIISERDKISKTNVSNNQESINKQSETLTAEIAKIDKDIENIVNGKSSINVDVKKTANELVFPAESKREWYERFISAVLEGITIWASFMWRRKKRLDLCSNKYEDSNDYSGLNSGVSNRSNNNNVVTAKDQSYIDSDTDLNLGQSKKLNNFVPDGFTQKVIKGFQMDPVELTSLPQKSDTKISEFDLNSERLKAIENIENNSSFDTEQNRDLKRYITAMLMPGHVTYDGFVDGAVTIGKRCNPPFKPSKSNALRNTLCNMDKPMCEIVDGIKTRLIKS